MQITNISDAKATLSFLIRQVQETNEPIIIGKAGKPVAMLSAYSQDISPRKLQGNWKGKVIIADDFDDPCADINDDFYSSTVFPTS